MTTRLARITFTTLAAVVTTAGGIAGAAAAAVPAHRDVARQVINLDSDTVVVYEDGRVYRRSDLGDWYQPRGGHGLHGIGGSVRMAPPPPPGAFEWAELSEDAVEDLLELVDHLGLDDDLDFGDPMISDSPTSRLELVVDDEEVSHSVYAPGFNDGLTSAQQQNRAAYEELRAVLFDLESEFGSELTDFAPYVPDSWIVGGPRMVTGDVERPWPLERPPVDGECVALPTAADSDTATGGYRYAGDIVIADATLPNDPRCTPPTTTAR